MDQVNILSVSGRNGTLLAKEIERVNVARSIALDGTCKMFLLLDQTFRENGLPGCIFLAEIFATVQNDAKLKKSQHQVIELLMCGARERINFGDKF